MQPTETDGTKRDADNNPVTWFAMLERARQDDDLESAAKAKQELERLGVAIKFRRPARRQAMIASEPLLLDAAQAAALCNVSRATWFSWQASGLIPAAVLRRRHVVRWSAEEIRRWCESACPSRERWEVIKQGRKT
jgi:predicted DNA-binding transcriptional regulator AlpA